MKVVAIIQARMGSTRLPGKVMKEILAKTVLEHVINRVKQSKSIDEIVIATTVKLDDKVIEIEAERLGVKVFRGSEEDVLSRYYYAAKESNADVIIRITSDCPLIDPKVIDEMIYKFKNLHKDNKVDYLSNTLQRTFPRGLDTEVFSSELLNQTFNNAKEIYQREHVTPYIYENPDRFKLVGYKNNIDYSDHRWTLDTQEDFELITKIYEELYNGQQKFYLTDIIGLFDKHPELIKINEQIEQKSL